MRDRLLTLLLLAGAAVHAGEAFTSHPPMRPLPAGHERPLPEGPVYYVDGDAGADANDGSQRQPWRTIQHGVDRLEPGNTLCLREGTYYQGIRITGHGTAAQPITVRACPGELVVIDGGFREFFAAPAEAWEPAPAGVEGEYRSTRVYTEHGSLNGNFGDSMVPLFKYRSRQDLQSDNLAFGRGKPTYMGPGIWYNAETGRIHARLAHTALTALGQDNYRGVTDPRDVPLVIGARADAAPLRIVGAAYVRIQDMVFRGTGASPVVVTASYDIEFNGCTMYGGGSAFGVSDTHWLRLYHCALRGVAAPWTFRGHLKYRSREAKLVSASGWTPNDCAALELAHCEFTDSIDGVFVGNVDGVEFHHNLLANCSDDGMFLTATTAPDGVTPGGPVRISRNVFRRTLSAFAFGTGHGWQKTLFGPDGEKRKQLGDGVRIYRNLIDLRRPVLAYAPRPDEPALSTYGRTFVDHGGLVWERMWLYHNTALFGARNGTHGYFYRWYGTFGPGTTRYAFNNIHVNVRDLPGSVIRNGFARPGIVFDATLHWSVEHGADAEKPLAKRTPGRRAIEKSKAFYPPGLFAHDRYADPAFRRFDGDWRAPVDLGLTPESPAVDAGVPIPAAWPDPVRDRDTGRPDIGMAPLGDAGWRVGVGRRLDAFGQADGRPPAWAVERRQPEPAPIDWHRFLARKPAAIMYGYPAPERSCVVYLLQKLDARIAYSSRDALPAADYRDYRLVVHVDGGGRRYTEDDLGALEAFLTNGGTLLVLTGGRGVFADPAVTGWLDGVVGGDGPGDPYPRIRVRKPDHPWLAHLDPDTPPGWLTEGQPLRARKGERIVGSETGYTMLLRRAVGKGQFIYVGWRMTGSPDAGTRSPWKVSSAQQQTFVDQVLLLRRILESVYPDLLD